MPGTETSVAMRGACMSVGNPGKGRVEMLMGLSSMPRASTCAQSLPTSTLQPISRKASRVEAMCSGIIFVTFTQPRVIAAPQRYVPASIRSGMV